MTLVDPERISPLQDNVLVVLDMHANAQAEERRLESGLYIPKTADNGASAIHGETVPATIVAVGPGRWTDTYRDQEKGSVPYGDGFWLPMNPLLKPGARVMVDSPDQGDKVFARDKAAQYRLVREENIVMLWDGEDWQPLGDCVIVAPDQSDQQTEGGIFIPGTLRNKPTEGEVLAVGPGKRIPGADAELELRTQYPEVRAGLPEPQYRAMSITEGDRVVYGKFAGHKVVIEGVELLLLREESVLAVVSQEERKERPAGSFEDLNRHLPPAAEQVREAIARTKAMGQRP